MTTTVPADMLAEIQGWAPGGGFVQSEHRAGDRVNIGDLIRHQSGWAVITSISHESPVVVWRDVNGNHGSRVLWACSGVEVRTDTRIDPATLEQS